MRPSRYASQTETSKVRWESSTEWPTCPSGADPCAPNPADPGPESPPGGACNRITPSGRDRPTGKDKSHGGPWARNAADREALRRLYAGVHPRGVGGPVARRAQPDRYRWPGGRRNAGGSFEARVPGRSYYSLVMVSSRFRIRLETAV